MLACGQRVAPHRQVLPIRYRRNVFDKLRRADLTLAGFQRLLGAGVVITEVPALC